MHSYLINKILHTKLTMSAEKLKNVEVPKKFSEWLLAMGCPQEDVPSLDKITEMCRGQYYMVWRSLMERVAPKDVITNKRHQVFVDDVLQCQKMKFQEKSNNTVMPSELSLWHRQADLKQKVADAEAKLLDEKKKLEQLREKVNAKLSQRHLAKQKLSDAQRRAWLLQLVAAQLREKKADLVEARAIGDSLCSLDDDSDVASKLDKCISLMSRQSTNRGALASANPVNMSIASNNSDNNDAVEEISSLLKCGGEAVFSQLYERRAGLCPRIEALRPPGQDKQRTPQSVLAETAGLHCTLALEDVKNKNYIKQTMSRFEAALDELSNSLTDTEACELLVVHCEKTKSEARIKTIRELTEDLNKRQGIFYLEPCKEGENLMKQIKIADKSIVSKKDELIKLITTTLRIEQKALNAKDCLLNLFNSFHQKTTEITCFGPTSLPQESISTMRQFYEEKRDKAKNKVDLSMDLDVSDSSLSDNIENGNPKFVDELKFYLKNFNLEKNRKLVLKSGEKIWISETVQSYLNSFYHKLVTENLNVTIISPAISLSKNLEVLSREMQAKNDLEMMVKGLQDGRKKSWSFDIKTQTEEEQRTLDKIKKRLNEDIITLQRTEKNLDVVNENLKFWRENNARKLISMNRMVDGKTYKEFELSYREGLMI